MTLSFTKAEEQAKISYLSTLVDQIWIIIGLLLEMNSKLHKKKESIKLSFLSPSIKNQINR